MELTPQQLCEVEFSEQWRGYNRDQVDDFIERVAAAVSTLQDRLRKMTERAVRAEQKAQEGSEADGAARRTLVLAQRTADATMAEAKETAARVIAQAQEEARAIILASETAVDTVPTAEPTARAEIADLEVTRSRLQADVAALESHVTDRRARIKGLLDELQRRVDEGLEGRIAQWPSPDDGRILLDDPAGHDYGDYDDVVVLDDVPVADADPVDTASADRHATSPEPEPLAESESDDYVEADPPADLAPAPPEWEPQDAGPRLTELHAEVGERQDDLAMPAPAPDYAELSARDVDDDTFFAQLRGALDDDAPLGPREDAHGVLRWREEAATAVAEAPGLYDQGESEGRRFGRKKRRQRRQA
jgi:cell division initiation protein